MEEIYKDAKNPGALGGVKRLAKAANVSQLEAREFLESRDEYTVSKERRKKFERNPIVVINLREQFQVDLADMSKFAAENENIKFLLVAIDCFSRLASVQPLRDKTGPAVVRGLKRAFEDLGEPERVQSDKGKEFWNSSVAAFLKARHVTHFTSENADIKCAMAERLIRTLKQKIWRLFRLRGGTIYLDKLSDLVHAYNHSEHSALGMRPVDVKDNNSLTVFNKLYCDILQPRAPKFSVGDSVRIAKTKLTFEKGFEHNFTEEIYTIIQVIPHSRPCYRIADHKNRTIRGTFYEEELSKVKVDSNKEYRIDKVIKVKGSRALVRWLGYGPEHDSWVPRKNIVNNA